MRRFAAGAVVVVSAAVALAAPAAHLSAPGGMAPEPQTSVRVLFAGDLMLDRNVARTAEERGIAPMLSGVRELFAGADLRVVNLEGTITEEESIARKNNKILRFTFTPELARAALEYLHLDAVSLANNHALDFYQAGYTQTQEHLDTWGVAHFGHPLNTPGRLSTQVVVEGKTLCFVGYHSLFTADTSSVLEEIKTLRPNCWRLVVMPHWGEEYQPRSHAGQQEAAHAFIDAGADLVVGAHPHVVQEVERYQGRAIFYSLGNFLFDQNFSWETMHGLAVLVDFGEEETHFSLIPTTVAQQVAGVTEGQDRLKTLTAAGVLGEAGPVAEFSLP